MPENRVKLPPSKTRRITHEEFANAVGGEDAGPVPKAGSPGAEAFAGRAKFEEVLASDEGMAKASEYGPPEAEVHI